jgi:hypothetical protein
MRNFKVTASPHFGFALHPDGFVKRCRSMRSLHPVKLLLALVLLGGFSFTPPHRELTAAAPLFRPEQFFLGRTEGRGTIKEAFSSRYGFAQVGIGRLDGDGTLVLDQQVKREGKPQEHRLWRMRKLKDGRYTGTISDARGPVTAEVAGNCLHLRFTIARGGFQAEQFLYLQPGGQSALNRMTLKKFGVTVATIEETIRRT